MTGHWTDRRDLYSLYLTSVPPAYISSLPSTFQPVSSLEEWANLWKMWDVITLDMIPNALLLERPIDLRNPCIFHIGHIPTFLDIHLSRVGDSNYTNKHYTQIFERGIDPDVDDPTQCHSHSEIPDTWPDLAEILQFRGSVRARLRKIYDSGAIKERKVARAVFTVYEHEAMHTETLLYMLIQSDVTLPPKGINPVVLRSTADRLDPAVWIDVPQVTIDVGMDDVEGQNDGIFFGWDNEKSRRQMTVESFSIQNRPVSNGEYAHYLRRTTEEGKKWRHPKGWTPDMRVRTVFGSIPLAQAANWPVVASYDELERYANCAGARLPTFAELRHFIDSNSTTSESAGTPSNNVLGKGVNFNRWVPIELHNSPEPQVYIYWCLRMDLDSFRQNSWFRQFQDISWLLGRLL